jgi:hypothetical protein
MNDASLEIAEKKEANKEEVFSWIKVELQEVQQALQSVTQFLLRLYQ